MISKKQIKFINSLKYNKYRLKYNCFIAEGEHVINDFINSGFIIESLFLSSSISNNTSLLDEDTLLLDLKFDTYIVPEKDFKKISCLKTPSGSLAVIKKPDRFFKDLDLFEQNQVILLDSISDPGNMGTIIRTADWYGFKNIYVSENCVDVYSPKVVQATMGSLSRVKVFRLSLEFLLKKLKNQNFLCYATTLQGNNLYQIQEKNKCVLVFGNESHGVDKKLLSLIDKEISIPKKNIYIDSLNVSVAFGIILSEFR